MTKVKVCGLTRGQDIDAVNAVQPDYIGFVFAPSRRQVTPQQARVLKKRLLPGILSVGVFVDAAPADIAALAEDGTIDLVQLHGDEDAEYIHRLRARTNAPLIKAVRTGRTSDMLAAQALGCQYLLLDSGGGSGQTFDWAAIPRLDVPFFLAGGIGTHNAMAAAWAVQPFALDASSALESGGVKDREKIAEFVTLVKEMYV